MKLDDFRESYHDITTKASNIARSTNYSLIAVVWVLCGQDVSKIETYKYAILFIILSLICDYLQYLSMAFIGSIKYLIDEKKVSEDKSKDNTDEIGYPCYTPYISTTFFIFKFIFEIVAVIYLVYGISQK